MTPKRTFLTALFAIVAIWGAAGVASAAGEASAPDAAAGFGAPPTTHTIQFPRDHTLGRYSLRDWDVPGQAWRDAGEAYGRVVVPAGAALRLRISPYYADDFAFLATVGPGNIQALVLSRTRVTDQDLEHLSGFARLFALELDGTQITDDGLARLTRLTSLRALALGGAAVTDAGLRHLAPLRSLETLGLESTQITDAGLEDIGKMTSLKRLGLESTPITDDGLPCLKGLSALENLALDQTRITNAGLVHLQGFQVLGELRLRYVRITDAGLHRLWGLESLRRIDVTGTRITRGGAGKLSRVVPDLDVASLRLRTFPPRLWLLGLFFVGGWIARGIGQRQARLLTWLALLAAVVCLALVAPTFTPSLWTSLLAPVPRGIVAHVGLFVAACIGAWCRFILDRRPIRQRPAV